MKNIEFVHLSEVKEDQIIELMNNEMVGKHLPLLGNRFSLKDCRTFLREKKRLWEVHGYGPWAILIDNEFAGWGGLQAEDNDADFALVLHPQFWGWGLNIFYKIKEQAFRDMGLESITALLPPNRTNAKAITRLGFVKEEDVIINNQIFLKFRLCK